MLVKQVWLNRTRVIEISHGVSSSYHIVVCARRSGGRRGVLLFPFHTTRTAQCPANRHGNAESLPRFGSDGNAD